MENILKPRTDVERRFSPDSWRVANNIINQDFNNPEMKNRIVYLLDKRKYSEVSLKQVYKILETHTNCVVVGKKKLGENLVEITIMLQVDELERRY